jgi:aryl-alcohol dehydrogenase-like predicted oxidoreductase
LQAVKPEVVVGTKVQLKADQMTDVASAIIEAAEVSLGRLQLERLDLFQLHNAVGVQRQAERGWIGADDLAAVVRGFQTLQAQGKIRFWGLNGLGETEALHRIVAESGADTLQSCYNLLNPSAGRALPPGFPGQDYGRLIDHANEQGMGVIAIRVLAAGALSGQAGRHPLAAQSVAPIGSGPDFVADVAQAQRFQFLIDDGWVDSLIEAAIRFALSKATVSTALVGLSSLEQLEEAIAAAEKGPLLPAALDRLPEVWAAMAG